MAPINPPRHRRLALVIDVDDLIDDESRGRRHRSPIRCSDDSRMNNGTRDNRENRSTRNRNATDSPGKNLSNQYHSSHVVPHNDFTSMDSFPNKNSKSNLPIPFRFSNGTRYPRISDFIV